jgi:hypothetical protein
LPLYKIIKKQNKNSKSQVLFSVQSLNIVNVMNL